MVIPILFFLHISERLIKNYIRSNLFTFILPYPFILLIRKIKIEMHCL